MPGFTSITTAAELDSIKDTEKLVVVKFTASWCGPCKKIQPALDALAVAEDANVVFVSVDVEAAAEAGWECGIDALPTFRFIRDGIQLDQFATPAIEKVVQGVNNFK